MQAVGPALPELYHIWRDPEAAPVGRPRYFTIPILLRQVLNPPFQVFPAVEHRALLGRNRAQPAADGPGLEICIRFLSGDLAHRPLDPDLPLEGPPPEHQRGV